MARHLSAASGPQRARCGVFAQLGAPRGAGRGRATGGTRRWHRAASATIPCIPRQRCWVPSAHAGATCGLPGAGEEPPRSSRGLSILCQPSWRAVCQEQTRRGRAVPAQRRLFPDKHPASSTRGQHPPPQGVTSPRSDPTQHHLSLTLWGHSLPTPRGPAPALSRETQHADAFPWLYCAQ